MLSQSAHRLKAAPAIFQGNISKPASQCSENYMIRCKTSSLRLVARVRHIPRITGRVRFPICRREVPIPCAHPDRPISDGIRDRHAARTRMGIRAQKMLYFRQLIICRREREPY